VLPFQPHPRRPRGSQRAPTIPPARLRGLPRATTSEGRSPRQPMAQQVKGLTKKSMQVLESWQAELEDKGRWAGLEVWGAMLGRAGRGDSCANPPPPRLATHCNGQTHATLGEGVGLQADGQGSSFSHGAWLAMPPRRRIASARSPERCPSDGLPAHPGNRGAQALAGFAPIIGCEYASAATHVIRGGGQIDYVKGPRTELCKIASFVRNRVSKLTSAIEAPSTESAWVRPRSSQ
jgi:hypothetical protein